MKKKFTIEFTQKSDGSIGVETNNDGFSFIEIIGLLDTAKHRVISNNPKEDEKHT